MSIEELYQVVGRLALANAPGLSGKLLVYAEVQQGVIESGMFYERDVKRIVTFRYCTDELEDRLYELWERWKETPGNAPWFGLTYLVQDNKLQIDLLYPEQVNAREGLLDRRPRLVKQYFGDVKIDFSTPGD
ncbi:MAG: hypothetical protein INR62_04465 [Rhodospirillales bacterium]|nr:hypothetical protein [Acetobacter sp.]